MDWTPSVRSWNIAVVTGEEAEGPQRVVSFRSPDFRQRQQSVWNGRWASRQRRSAVDSEVPKADAGHPAAVSQKRSSQSNLTSPMLLGISYELCCSSEELLLGAGDSLPRAGTLNYSRCFQGLLHPSD